MRQAEGSQLNSNTKYSVGLQAIIKNKKQSRLHFVLSADTEYWISVFLLVLMLLKAKPPEKKGEGGEQNCTGTPTAKKQG